MDQECEVNGPLALILRLSRLAGVAPVRFVFRSGRLFLQYSLAFDICGRIVLGCLLPGVTFVFILNVILTGKINEILSQKLPVAITFSISVAIIVIYAICAVFRSPQRMKALIENIKAVKKLNITEKRHFKDQRNINEAVIYLIFLSILLSFDMWIVLITEISEDFNAKAVIRMFQFCIGYTVMVFLNMQFIFVAIEITHELHSVNQQLENLTVDLKKTSFYSNSAIKSASMTIHTLANAYSHLCSIIRKMDREQGILLIITLTLLITFFEISGFLLVMCLVNQSVSTLGVKLDNNLFDVSLQAAWCIFHSLSIILLIEPCQWTLSEMESTKVLVLKLKHKASYLGAALNSDLDIFLSLIVNNNASYSPLKLITLGRPLTLKVIAGLVSYLCIILQFNVKG